METLPRYAIKLLKRIDCLEEFKINPASMRAIKILGDRGYIKFHQPLTINSLIENDNWQYYFTITSEGRVYLSDSRHSTIRYWIPIAISNLIAIIALIISIIALVSK